MSKKPATRTFDGTCKGEPFKVETTLTNDQAARLLRESGQDFNLNCADHVEIAGNSLAKPNLVAWGFRKAEALANPPKPVCLSEAVLKRVAFRRPMRGSTNGLEYKVSLAGPNSKHHGRYLIGNGGVYNHPASRFYGYGEPDGTWTPREETPECIIAALTS